MHATVSSWRTRPWVTGDSPRRVLIYSGNMSNELPDVPYVITMEVTAEPDPMDVELPEGLRVAYTRLDHSTVRLSLSHSRTSSKLAAFPILERSCHHATSRP